MVFENLKSQADEEAIFRSTGTIDLASLPPGLFQPYIIAETRLGSYRHFQVAYSGADGYLNLYGMELPRWLNYLADNMGTLNRAQSLGQSKLSLAYEVNNFVRLTPAISGDIAPRTNGPAAGTLDYSYSIGVIFSDGSKCPAGGMLRFLPKFVGVEAGGQLDLMVAGSSSTHEAPGYPSITLSGQAFGGVSADMLKLLAPGGIDQPVKLITKARIGGGIASTELGALPTTSTEYYRPLQRRMKTTLEGGASGAVVVDVLGGALYDVPVIGPVLAAGLSEIGTGIPIEFGAAAGVTHSRERTTRYRVPGELLEAAVPPPVPDRDAGSIANMFPPGQVEPEETALTQLAGIIGDEVLFRAGNTTNGLYGGFSVAAGASLAFQAMELRLETQGPASSIIKLPTLLFELNRHGDFPPVKRITGSVKGTVQFTSRLFLAKGVARYTLLDVPVDVPLNTEEMLHLVPMDVEETTISLTSAPAVTWCGAEPHLAASYSSLAPHAAATSGPGQTMAFIDPDSAGGVMRLKVAKQPAQGAWTAPVTVASAPGIVSMAINASPGGAGFAVAWSEITIGGLTEFAPVTTIKYSLSSDGLAWSPATTLGTTTGGTATNLKWLAMTGGTMGLVWQ